MRKLTALFVFCLIAADGIYAQASEDKVEYQKKDEPAIAIELPYPPSVVEGAWLQKMEKMGNKARESKGFRNYKGTVITQISTEPLDYIIRVERKSRKEKDESVLYMLIYKGDGNLLPIMDAAVKSRAKIFLNDFKPFAEAYNLEQEILAQEEIVEKALKKQSSLENDLDDLEKRKKKIEDDIEQNKKDQEKQKEEIKTQQQILEAIKAKRKG